MTETRRPIGRTKIGYKDGSRQRTTTFSKRAERGLLSVIQKHCEKCGHHKFFVKTKKLVCTKCGYQID